MLELRKLLPLLILVVVLSMAALVGFYPPNGDFRIDNPFWNGLTTLDAQSRVSPIDTFSSLPSDARGTALFVVPYEKFAEVELGQLKGYVSNGGTLVILDDYGYGNQVLSGLGLNMMFTGEPLLDPLFNYRNKLLPKISDFAATPFARNVSSVVFNHASCLNVTSDVTVVAYSSRFSFLDLNGDAEWDADEPTGPLPVVAYVKMSQGYVVVISDPSLLINGMIGMDDNQQFVNNVAGLQGGDSQFFVDQTHLPKAPLDEAKETVAVVYGAVSSPLGTLTLIAVALALSLKPIWRKGGKLDRKR